MVERKKLSLDHDIQPLLKIWTLKGSSLNAAEPVTLRRLLNHTAGVNEISGVGYAPGTVIPTVTQILDGLPSTNTPAVRIETTPGSRWFYSSGGDYVVQALMTDVSGEAFPRLADRLVLRPAGMNDSIFGQPLDTKRARLAVAAVGPDGSAMPGGWRINPELAAGGLWSTPSDLARLAIALARSARGKKPDRRLYWARIGHVGRELLPESETRLFSPDSRMSLEAVDKEARRAETLEPGFGGGKNVAERVE